MASLDLARGYLADYDSNDLTYLLNELSEFKKGLNNIPGISVLDYPGPGDPLKVTIQSVCTLNGFQLQKIIEDAGLYAELADPYNLLLVLPLLKEKQPFPFCEALEKIKEALINVSVRPSAVPGVTGGHQKISSLAISFKEMNKRKAVNIIITEAAGKIAAETVIPYPPGIPLLLKGERITGERIEILKRLIADHARFQGGSVLDQKMLKVFGG
jgi:arginine/lysine/ornithine decarboxylase